MKCKRMTAAVCALALAAGMAGTPAADVFGADTAITASAEDRIVLGGTSGPQESDFEFDGDIGYKELDDGTVEVGYYRGTASSLTIPTKLNEKTVSGISAFAFINGTLTSITIPSGVKNIDSSAFVLASALSSIIVKNGNSNYSSIDGVLYNKNATELIACPQAAEKIVFPDSVTKIGSSAFYNCRTLTSVSIPDNVTSIGDEAFAGCTGLKSVTIPNSVKVIDGDAFSGCKGLTSVTIPNGVTSINDGLFSHCTGLKTVSIPNGINSIGDFAFYDCTALSSVTIPDSVTEIGTWAFENCKSLTSVTILSSVISIYEDAFDDCPNLVIKCYANTEAEDYAKWEGIPYELIDGGSSSTKTSISKATAKFSATKLVYSGKSKMPKLTVTMDGKTLVKGKDYKVTGKNCKNPGKATITITGIGNYTGTKTMNFYIVPAKPTVTKATSTAKKKITLAWRKDALADGYQVVVYSNKACTKKVKSALVKKNTTVGGSLSGFTSGRTYYVRVRAYKTIDGSKKAGAFSAVKTVKVK